jgi:hypothetical protein
MSENILRENPKVVIDASWEMMININSKNDTSCE